jgi:dipeptidase E
VTRTIVAIGGGGFQMEHYNPLLDDYVLAIAPERSGQTIPRICLILTATGDDREIIADFERLFAPPRAEPRVLRLFGRTDDGLAAVIEEPDAVYVPGGSTENLLALSRLHGPDVALRDAWDDGLVLAGMSAGANCWFDAATTDSFGPTLRPPKGGIGILAGTFTPHLVGDAQCLALLRRLVADGTIPARLRCGRRRGARLPRWRPRGCGHVRPRGRRVGRRAGRRGRLARDGPPDQVPRFVSAG